MAYINSNAQGVTTLGMRYLICEDLFDAIVIVDTCEVATYHGVTVGIGLEHVDAIVRTEQMMTNGLIVYGLGDA